jgi:superfamily II DNA helicase RecQ
MLFFLLALMEPNVTTGILPLIEVMVDVRSRCIAAEISCSVWDLKNPLMVDTNLLLVAVEHAVEPRFRDHLPILYSAGRLKRIVMDEVHVALTRRSFRPGMRKLSVLRCVPVPALLLTATLPVWTENQLRTAIASEAPWQVVRPETTRKEIGYEVIEVDEEENPLDVEIAFRVKAEMERWRYGKETGIIYCLRRNWAEDLKELMD